MKPQIPQFVFVGLPNVGKTTMLSTVAQDDRPAVSDFPGETKQWREWNWSGLNGEESILRVYDTPGFQRPGAVLEWFQKHSQGHDTVNHAAKFLREFEALGTYPDECEIMTPLSKSGIALHVADPNVPVTEVDKQAMEILKCCRIPSIGVLNIRSGLAQYRGEWKDAMKSNLTGCIELDAHGADFDGRMQFLQNIAEIIPSSKEGIDMAIKNCEMFKSKQLNDAAEQIKDALLQVVRAKVEETIQAASDRELAKWRADNGLQKLVRDKENSCRSGLRQVFRHSSEWWLSADEELKADFFSEKAWKCIGLTGRQIVIVGAVGGAGIGTWVDIATGGGTVGIGATVGAIIGGAGAWVGAKQLVHVEVVSPEGWTFPKNLNWSKKKLGGETALARAKPNLVYGLADRCLAYFWHAYRWPHGRREKAALDQAMPDDILAAARTSKWSDEERKCVQRFYEVVRKSPDDDSLKEIGKVKELILNKLEIIAK